MAARWRTDCPSLATTSCAHVALKYLIKATKYMSEISYARQPPSLGPVDLRGVLGQRRVNRAYMGPVEDNEEEGAASTQRRAERLADHEEY